MKVRAFITILLLTLLATTAFSEREPFRDIKWKLNSAKCASFEFLSVHESNVFDTSDTTEGTSYIAQDGRYSITIGKDRYMCNGEFVYSYSYVQNQVTIELMGPQASREELSFITHLDKFFETECKQPNHEYFLTKISERAPSLPDSMTIFIDSTHTRLDRLEYLDQNEDKNIIIIKNQSTFDECDDSKLEPNYPLSADVVKLF